MRWFDGGLFWHLVDPLNAEIGAFGSDQGFAICMN